MSEDIIKNNIKLFRKKRGLTQTELANILGISQVHLGRLENNSRSLDLELIGKLSEALDVKPYELLPKEWQPQEITEEEKQLLELFRKKTDTQDTQIQTEDKTKRYKSTQR